MRVAQQSKDTYVLTNTYQDEKAIIRVYRPVLTEEERARRMQRLHDAAADFVRDCIRKGIIN